MAEYHQQRYQVHPRGRKDKREAFPQREEYFGGDMGQRSVYSP